MKRIRKEALGAGIAAVIAIGLVLPAGASATTFTVTQAADASDPNLGDGVCDVNGPTMGTPCSLRGAIETASDAASSGDDTVAAPVALGPYNISLGELLAAGNGPLTIQGTGGGRAVIDANSTSRVLDVVSTALTLQNVTLREGKTTGALPGAGLAFSSSAATEALTLNDSSIEANQARGSDTGNGASDNIDGFGGGIYATPSAAATPITITNSDITTNQAGNGSTSNGTGGGIVVIGDDPKLTLTGSNVNTNTATGEDGADGPSFVSSLGGNAGGIYLHDSDTDATVGSLTLTNSQINTNVAAPGTNPIGVNSGHSVSFAGGIYLVGSASGTAPTLTANGGSIDNNTAGGGLLDRQGLGGGIASVEGDAGSDIKLGTTTPLTMTGNKAGGGAGTGQGEGGAIYSFNDVSVKNSTVNLNTAGVAGAATGNGSGGGIDLLSDSGDYTSASLSVDGSTVSQNAAGGFSGAGGAVVMSTGGNLTVTGSTFDSNQAIQSGGAIHRTPASGLTAIVDTITDTQISNNSTQGRGGAVELFSDGTFHIERSALISNTSGTNGGAIDANSATVGNPLGNLELINSTLSQNTAAQGGAINADGSSFPISLALFLTTIAANSAPTASNVRYIGNMTNPPTLTVAGAIVALPNGGGQNCAAIPAGTVNFDNRGGNVTDGSSGTNPTLSCDIGNGTQDTSGSNPLLTTAANNGGPTQTMALQQGSPALGRATMPVCQTNSSGVDQRSISRPPSGVGCDSGAYEARLYSLDVTTAGAGTGTITGSGINCPGDCTEIFVEGSSVPLTATPSGGSSFGGWSGDCSGASCALTMDAARAVTATFSPQPAPTATAPAIGGQATAAPPSATRKRCKKGRKLKRGRCVRKKKKR